ncbi:MAG: ABC transporter ATP-binding protein [Lachnospiraceae bacterium]|nr:ABC transporter ATP-binding protein [Lachnospiraceae bacterium]
MIQNIKTLLYMLKQLVIILDKSQKKRCLFAFIFILIGAFFEMLGVSILLPFLQTLMAPEVIINNKYIKPILENLNIINTQNVFYLVSFSVMLLYIVKNLILLYSTYVQNVLSTSINRELSTLMLRSYMKRPYFYFLENNSADMLRGINGDVTGVYNIIANLFKLITELLTCLVIAILLLATDIFMATGVILVALLCLIMVVLVFKSKMRDMGIKQRISITLCNKHAYQSINGIKEITVMQRRDNFVKLFDMAADIKRETNLAYNFIIACPNRIIEAVCICGIIGVVCLKMVLGVEVEKFIPRLGVFAVAAFKVLPSIATISGNISSFVFYRPTLEEAYENITKAREYEKSRTDNAIKRVEENNQKANEEKVLENGFQDKISIRSIDWKYHNATRKILENCSLDIIKGESIAFIGTSGAGKTTLADIILGLLIPQSGTVEMDGIDIYSIPNAWAHIIGYVPQSIFLIDDTIRNNITFGLLSEEIDDEKIWYALEQAQIDDFIRNLPKGLDTIVGERGIKFSGGQRQRIAIARALYNNPDILVLDEATSALDSETEEAVMESIEALQEQKTLIIVAHRLTTIRNCKRIVEVSNGSIIERKKEEVLSNI